MPGERFTSWLSEDERCALREVAKREGCSENFVVRTALRSLLFGKEPSSFQRIREEAYKLRNHVTGSRT